jgi:rhamnulokinase
MKSPLRLVAVDLGAERGRGIVGSFTGEGLVLSEGYRFSNSPVRLGGTLYWDFLRLFQDILEALRRATADGPVTSAGVDTWGVDFGLLDDRGRLLANPVHYRDRRPEGILERMFGRVPREEIYRRTGIQFMPINTLCQMLAMADTKGSTGRCRVRRPPMPRPMPPRTRSAVMHPTPGVLPGAPGRRI